MTWWVVTNLNIITSPTTITLQATTNNPCDLAVAWSYIEPTYHPVYRSVRGVRKQTTHRRLWSEYTIVHQDDREARHEHTITIEDLEPGRRVWWYFWAPDGPFGNEVQGPLMHTDLPAA